MILDGLMETQREITANRLAFLSDSSVRTVKQDIIFLNECLEEENIARIRSTRSKGYVLEIIDQQKYKDLKDHVLVMQMMYYKRPIETMNRRLYIIHSLFAQDQVSIEQICEKLYLSDTSVRKEAEWVRSFLETYDLQIGVKNGHFYYVYGREEDFRSAAVEIHCSQYHEFQQTYTHEGFNIMFYPNKQIYEDIRHALLKILRDSDIAISDIAAKKIPTYICLLKSRLQKGKTVSPDEDKKEELKKTYDYKIAKKVSEDPVIKNYCELPEDEIIELTAIILTQRDIDMRTRGTAGLDQRHLSENAMIYADVMNKARKKLGASLYNVDFFHFYEIDMVSLQLQLYYRFRFDSTKRERLVTYLEGDEALISPVPMEMARLMICFLQKRLGEPIRDPIILAYAQLLEKMLKKVTYPYRKLRLLACSTEGLVYTQNMVENLLSHYQRYIATAESYNLYEMRKVDFSKYDAVVHSGSLMYYRYPLRTVSLREIDYRNTSSGVFDKLFKLGYDRTRLEEIRSFLNIYPDTQIRDVSSFIEKMTYRYGKDPKQQEELYERFSEKEAVMTGWSNDLKCFLTFFDYELTQKEFIDIYINSEEGNKSPESPRYIIIASIDPKNPISSLKIDNHIIQFFMQVEGKIEEALKDKDKTLDEMFDRIIEVNFYGY